MHALVEAGYVVYTINPKAASRYRDRHTLSGAKSDPGDAKMLAELVRTDRHNHRQVAGDSALSEGIKILARAHQSLVWERTRAANRLRSSLTSISLPRSTRSLSWPIRDTLGAGSGGDTGRGSQTHAGQDPHRVASSRSAARHRSRRCDCYRVAQRRSRAPAAVESAHGATTQASVAILVALNTQIDVLASELADHFERRPDSDFYLSLPGVGVVLGARALGEFGDDPNRYADAKSRKATPGTSPITRASGTALCRARPVRSQQPPR